MEVFCWWKEKPAPLQKLESGSLRESLRAAAHAQLAVDVASMDFHWAVLRTRCRAISRSIQKQLHRAVIFKLLAIFSIGISQA
jgi:hypothetical protein